MNTIKKNVIGRGYYSGEDVTFKERGFSLVNSPFSDYQLRYGMTGNIVKVLNNYIFYPDYDSGENIGFKVERDEIYTGVDL